MKIRIGTKISLLTCTMVLVASLYLAERVMRYCAHHVVDHEVVDLVDETNLSAQKMLRNADEMRQDLSELAEHMSTDAIDDLREAYRTGGDPDSLSPRVREDLAGLLNQDRDFLQADILAWRAGDEPAAATRVARWRRKRVIEVEPPVGQAEFLNALAGGRPRLGQLSKFGQTRVTFEQASEARVGSKSEDVPVDGRKLILQGGAVIVPPSDGVGAADAPEPGFLILVTSHFSQLDHDTSNDEQQAISPRHFLFLLDQDDRFLEHPDPAFIADLSKPLDEEPQKSLDRADREISQRFREIDQLMALPDGTEEVRLVKELGRTVREKRIPSLRSWFGFTRGLRPSGQIISIFDPDLDDPEFTTKRNLGHRFKVALDKYLIENPQYKISLPSRDIRRFKIRCQSDREKDIAPFQQKIERLLGELRVTEKITWESPVRLEEFALHLLRLPYEPNHKDRYLDLVVAVSYQEIASDVDAELLSIRVGAIACSLGAGALAVLFSLMITRPLNKIITSTKRLAHGEFDLVLPVEDRGEVGELARSFKVMAEQLLERRRAVQEEQAKIRQLNEDLKRERDSLDVRVRERTTELLRTNSELESARDAALEASRAKSAFLAQMSHELRTPLNAIIGYGELLVEEFAEGPAAQFVPDLKKIIDSGRHLLGLINDILDLSKVEAGKMELFFETFEVRPLIESVVSTVEPLIRKNGNRLDWTCDPGVHSLRADRTRVRQVLLNLLSNSAKFTAQGEIHVTAVLEPVAGHNHIVFRVRDTGVGMTPEQMKRLFQNFSQADASTTRKYGGTGLGLAICKRFCEMMGGDILVDSEYQKGSTFSVRLPISGPPQLAAPQTTPSESSGGADAESDGQAGTVLVIDDDPAARDLLQRQFSREGFRVVTATGGEEGLQMVRDIRPTFITLDVMMPGMDGWDVLSALKADRELCDIPVVVLTMVDDKNLGMALGAAEYVTKPIDKDQLLSLSRKYRSDAGDGQSILVVEDDSNARSLMTRILKGDGWSVTEAENGRSALAALPNSIPALILLDLMMPEMDGFTFLRELRKEPAWRSIPVVIVTAKELTPQERSLLNGGVHMILQKGTYNREQLLDEVRKLLPARGAKSAGTEQSV
ncbi:MAG: response regulator [Planctomycetia bacterium]|nr:response regulator [Planctomycetia bacterium]